MVEHARHRAAGTTEQMGFAELKQRQAQVWGLSPYEAIAATLRPMHEAVLDDVITPVGARWLDVGCGTGELSRMAAAAGAVVTGVDLTPTLLETARARAAEERLAISYAVGDVERLPYDDASFDVVTSSVAACFAPDHLAVARELTRVCRTGGQLVVTAWVDAGLSAQFPRVIAKYAPPPPSGVGNPISWGDENYVHDLLAAAFALRLTRLDCPLVGESPQSLMEITEKNLGTCTALLSGLTPEDAASLRAELVAVLAEHVTEDGTVEASRPYLLVTGRRLAQ